MFPAAFFLPTPREKRFVQKPQNARLWWETVFAWFAENIADR